MAIQPKQFFFVHIPKTAGTTFILTLSRLFLWKKRLSYYTRNGRKRHAEESLDYKNKFDLCYGHVPFIYHEIKRGTVYYTFLREPRARLLSGYKHIKSDTNHGLRKKIDIDATTLKDFLKKGITPYFDNLMVRYISGNLYKPFMEINEHDLALAIKNLDTHFPVYGMTEYFDESLVLLADYMKWPPIYYAKENKSSYQINPAELDEETEKLITACNKYDQLLYQHAKTRFLNMMNEKRDTLTHGLVELKNGSEKRKGILTLRNKLGRYYSLLKRRMS